MIDNLTVDDVSSFFLLILKFLALGYGLVISHSEFFCDFQMNLNPWAECERYSKCEQALELNGR